LSDIGPGAAGEDEHGIGFGLRALGVEDDDPEVDEPACSGAPVFVDGERPLGNLKARFLVDFGIEGETGPEDVPTGRDRLSDSPAAAERAAADRGRPKKNQKNRSDSTSRNVHVDSFSLP
jgi:hypothetical protein